VYVVDSVFVASIGAASHGDESRGQLRVGDEREDDKAAKVADYITRAADVCTV
jgi:hypothetical protein